MELRYKRHKKMTTFKVRGIILNCLHRDVHCACNKYEEMEEIVQCRESNVVISSVKQLQKNEKQEFKHLNTIRRRRRRKHEGWNA